jgi:hypothetical protein
MGRNKSEVRKVQGPGSKVKEKRGPAQTVREAARRLGTFTTDDLYRADCDNYFRKPQITSALRDFCKSGEVRKVQGPGSGVEKAVYEYVAERTWGFGVREKVYRAMHVKGLFTVRDIHVLSDAEHSYVCALVRRLIESADIEPAGRAPGPRRPEAAYRVRNRDDFFLKFVRGSRGGAKTQGV